MRWPAQRSKEIVLEGCQQKSLVDMYHAKGNTSDSSFEDRRASGMSACHGFFEIRQYEESEPGVSQIIAASCPYAYCRARHHAMVTSEKQA